MIAFARRATRCSARPSRATAVRAPRSAVDKNPGRIIIAPESNQVPVSTQAFRVFTESRYLREFKGSRPTLPPQAGPVAVAARVAGVVDAPPSVVSPPAGAAARL